MRSRFARSTIPKEKRGLLVVYVNCVISKFHITTANKFCRKEEDIYKTWTGTPRWCAMRVSQNVTSVPIQHPLQHPMHENKQVNTSHSKSSVLSVK